MRVFDPRVMLLAQYSSAVTATRRFGTQSSRCLARRAGSTSSLVLMRRQRYSLGNVVPMPTSGARRRPGFVATTSAPYGFSGGPP